MIGKMKLQHIYCFLYLKDEHYFESEYLQKTFQRPHNLNYSEEENFNHETHTCSAGRL